MKLRDRGPTGLLQVGWSPTGWCPAQVWVTVEEEPPGERVADGAAVCAQGARAELAQAETSHLRPPDKRASSSRALGHTRLGHLPPSIPSLLFPWLFQQPSPHSWVVA